MAQLIYVTGGARSGKSSFAESLLEKESAVLYIATAIPFDGEMRDRIARHRADRNPLWKTMEQYSGFKQNLPNELEGISAVLLDCLTVMVTNILLSDENVSFDSISKEMADLLEMQVITEIEELLSAFDRFEGPVVLVSNETGMGIVPETPLCRLFRDIAGRVNQYCAARASSAYLLVSGIPMKLKGVAL